MGRNVYIKTTEAYEMTDEQKERAGLKPKKRSKEWHLRVAVPEHYDVRGVWWESRFITENELPSYLQQYPNLQIIYRREVK